MARTKVEKRKVIDPYSIFSGPAGSTPVEEDQRPFLVNSAISTRGELDGAEQSDIFKATVWLDQTNIRTENLLTQKQLQTIHTKMFEDVWLWAGKLRTRKTNIGDVMPREIPFKIVDLCRDVWTMLADTTGVALSKSDVAIRFHHRLVTDKLLTSVGEKKFTWGISTYPVRKALREAYLAALRTADSQYKYDQLLAFARS